MGSDRSREGFFCVPLSILTQLAACSVSALSVGFAGLPSAENPEGGGI